MDKDTISKYRSEVIERFINVEWLINAIISQHYFGRDYLNFLLEVLYDEYFSFGLKRRILEKIIKNINNQKIQELNRLNTIRNYFAHCNQQFLEITDIEDVVTIKDGKVVIEETRGKVIDPRNTKKEINFEELHADFMRTVGGVEKYLAKLFQGLGGVVINFPRPYGRGVN